MNLKSCVFLFILLSVSIGSTKIQGKSLPRVGGYASVGRSDVEGNSTDINDINYSAGIQAEQNISTLGFHIGFSYLHD